MARALGSRDAVASPNGHRLHDRRRNRLSGGFYLATHTDFGWIFGAGLFGLATAWVSTTTLAYLAIRRSLIDQHKEWMIRSYVVTFAFVTFRVIQPALQAARIGTELEQLAVAAWACWAVPLLITELVIQGRKVLAVRTN
jgi:Predicted membrane protein (DUF2306)